MKQEYRVSIGGLVLVVIIFLLAIGITYKEVEVPCVDAGGNKIKDSVCIDTVPIESYSMIDKLLPFMLLAALILTVVSFALGYSR